MDLALRCCCCRTRYVYRYHYYPSYWGAPLSGAHLLVTLGILAVVVLVLAGVRALRG